MYGEVMGNGLLSHPKSFILDQRNNDEVDKHFPRCLACKSPGMVIGNPFGAISAL